MPFRTNGFAGDWAPRPLDDFCSSGKQARARERQGVVTKCVRTLPATRRTSGQSGPRVQAVRATTCPGESRERPAFHLSDPATLPSHMSSPSGPPVLAVRATGLSAVMSGLSGRPGCSVRATGPRLRASGPFGPHVRAVRACPGHLSRPQGRPGRKSEPHVRLSGHVSAVRRPCRPRVRAVMCPGRMSGQNPGRPGWGDQNDRFWEDQNDPLPGRGRTPAAVPTRPTQRAQRGAGERIAQPAARQ